MSAASHVWLPGAGSAPGQQLTATPTASFQAPHHARLPRPRPPARAGCRTWPGYSKVSSRRPAGDVLPADRRQPEGRRGQTAYSSPPARKNPRSIGRTAAARTRSRCRPRPSRRSGPSAAAAAGPGRTRPCGRTWPGPALPASARGRGTAGVRPHRSRSPECDPPGSGQIHTSCQAGGITRALIRARVAGSVIGSDAAEKYRNPRPQRLAADPRPARIAARQLLDSGTLIASMRHARQLPASNPSNERTPMFGCRGPGNGPLSPLERCWEGALCPGRRSRTRRPTRSCASRARARRSPRGSPTRPRARSRSKVGREGRQEPVL